jgi:hypothetical protein
MDSRVLRGGASGPAEWLLVFLQARDVPPRARTGAAVGPAEWLMVFLDGVGAVRQADERAGRQAPSAAGERLSRADDFLGRLAARGA